MTEEAGRLLAQGRDCDVFEHGPGSVLRRSRQGRSLAVEARVMDYARSHGYPVPAVEELSSDGTAMVMELVTGPSMVAAIERRPWAIRQYGKQLANLHRRLHEIEAPAFVSPADVGHGDRLLHLDLHPLNVIMSPDGPVVIDWANAAAGDPGFDVGLTWLLMASAELPASGWRRSLLGRGRSVLVRSFLAGAGSDTAAELLGEIAAWKGRDPHMSVGETRSMRELVARVGAAGDP